MVAHEFCEHFKNITSNIMDCVACEKCKVWGKIQIHGLGTAFKVLTTNVEQLQSHNGSSFRATNQFNQSLVISLSKTIKINTLQIDRIRRSYEGRWKLAQLTQDHKNRQNWLETRGACHVRALQEITRGRQKTLPPTALASWASVVECGGARLLPPSTCPLKEASNSCRTSMNLLDASRVCSFVLLNSILSLIYRHSRKEQHHQKSVLPLHAQNSSPFQAWTSFPLNDVNWRSSDDVMETHDAIKSILKVLRWVLIVFLPCSTKTTLCQSFLLRFFRNWNSVMISNYAR